MESKQKILNWKKKEEKHLVLINPKMLRSQIGMINETVKCIRNYHYHCIWCTESLCGILCHIQALCSRNQCLLAEVQQMNTRVMDSLGIFPIIVNVPLLEHMWVLEKDWCEWGAAALTEVWKEKQRRSVVTAMRMHPWLLLCWAHPSLVLTASKHYFASFLSAFPRSV